MSISKVIDPHQKISALMESTRTTDKINMSISASAVDGGLILQEMNYAVSRQNAILTLDEVVDKGTS